jgi:hypothetical protein
MHADPLGKAVRNVEEIVEPLRKKMKELIAEDSNAVNRICPVYEQTAPYHQKKQRKIYPVKPADRKQMLFLKLFSHFIPPEK